MSSDADWLDCHRCGQALGTDPDDRPDGGTDGLPLCGECERNRDMEADLAFLDAQDGSIDGVIEW